MGPCRSRWTPTASTPWSTRRSTRSPTSSRPWCRTWWCSSSRSRPRTSPTTCSGLYDGVALTERWGTSPVELPDRIFVFRGPLLDMCDDRGGAGRGGPDHRGPRGRPPLRHRRRPAARPRLRLRTLRRRQQEAERAGERAPAAPSPRTYAVPPAGPRSCGLDRERGVGGEPTAEAGAEQGERVRRRGDIAVNSPSRNDPTTLTSRVPHGKPWSSQCPASRRSGAPTPAPRATRSGVTRCPPRPRRPAGPAGWRGGAPPRPRPGRRPGCRGGTPRRGRRRPASSSARVCSE